MHDDPWRLGYKRAPRKIEAVRKSLSLNVEQIGHLRTGIIPIFLELLKATVCLMPRTRISHMKNKKASASDDIPIEVYKLVFHHWIDPLLGGFNACLNKNKKGNSTRSHRLHTDYCVCLTWSGKCPKNSLEAVGI